MREMKNSGFSWLGEIPKNWSMQRVKHGFTRKNEKAMKENPVILSLARTGVKVRDISNNEGQIAESYFNYNPVEPGDLLLNPMDLYSGANCSVSNVSGVISPAYINLKSKDDINPFFYDYYFKVQYWMMAFFSYGKGVSFDNRWTLNAETLMSYPIVVLPYDEQCKIADYLDKKCSKIDTIIEKQRTVIEKLKAYKLSVITKAVTKGLNSDVEMKYSGVEWIGEIPSNWKITSISRLATVVRGASPRPAGDPLYFNGSDVPWITVAEVTKDDGKYITSTSEYLTSAGAEKSRMVESGTLLLSNSGATLGVPKVTLIDGCINDGSLAFYNLKIDQIFLLYILKSRTYELRKEMSGYGQPNLNTDIVKAIKIPLPPQEKQEDIVKYLDQKCSTIDKTIADRQVIIEKLGQYKKSLIYEVVTGKKEI